jgi:hypothetical protein
MFPLLDLHIMPPLPPLYHLHLHFAGFVLHDLQLCILLHQALHHLIRHRHSLLHHELLPNSSSLFIFFVGCTPMGPA